MQTILVVDDDARLRSLLSDYLASQAFFVATASNAAEAAEQLAWVQFDAMVLDRMMPGQDGLSFAKSLQQTMMPILMLTAMGDTENRIEGLEAGVQDYLAKPFEPRELVLRLKNLLRQKEEQTEATSCRFGEYHYDFQRRELRHHDELLRLTTSEAAYLHALAQAKGEAVSRESLAMLTGASARSVDVQMNRLRKKLEPEPSRPVYIQTVRGAGYVLKG